VIAKLHCCNLYKGEHVYYHDQGEDMVRSKRWELTILPPETLTPTVGLHVALGVPALLFETKHRTVVAVCSGRRAAPSSRRKKQVLDHLISYSYKSS
jgi:hypothetical protein